MMATAFAFNLYQLCTLKNAKIIQASERYRKVTENEMKFKKNGRDDAKRANGSRKTPRTLS